MARSNSFATEYIVSPGITAPSNYSFSIIVRNSGAPSTADFRIASELGPASSSTTMAGFAWSHTTASFQQSVFHRESGGSFQAAKLTSTLSADTWYYIGGRYDGTNVTAWLNGTQEASTAAAASGPGASPLIYVGSGVFGDSGLGFTYAECCWWSTNLSDGEMKALGQGVSPLLIRPASIIDGVSLVRGLVGYKGSTWSATGTSVADHPRVFMPRRRLLVPKAATGADHNITAAQTLPNLTSSATVLAIASITSAATIPNLTSSASINAQTTATITASPTLPNLTSSATVKGIASLTSAATIPNLTQAVTVKGLAKLTSAATLQNLTSAAEIAAGVRALTSAATLPNLTSSASVTATQPVGITSAATLPNLTSSATIQMGHVIDVTWTDTDSPSGSWTPKASASATWAAKSRPSTTWTRRI